MVAAVLPLRLRRDTIIYQVVDTLVEGWCTRTVLSEIGQRAISRTTAWTINRILSIKDTYTIDRSFLLFLYLQRSHDNSIELSRTIKVLDLFKSQALDTCLSDFRETWVRRSKMAHARKPKSKE